MSTADRKMDRPRQEYPRPQLQRKQWINLNGEWEFEFDDGNVGKREKWYLSHAFSRRIQVPFVYESERSGIHETEFHDVVWYRLNLDGQLLKKGGGPAAPRRMLLHFGACDYETEVWVNGESVGTHVGGQASFAFEITDYLEDSGNILVVRAADEHRNLEQPRGKQFWKQESASIFYTGTTGIWQTVWLEPLGEHFIRKVWMTPDVDRKMIGMEILLDQGAACSPRTCPGLQVEISYQGTVMVCDTVGILNGKAVREWKLDQNLNLEWEHKSYEWTPEHPVLFDVRFRLEGNGQVWDEAESYFAMRKVSVEQGTFLLNNRPYYQKLLLDQGYWRESLMTAPDDEALIRDIRLCKEMGFNGVRKHQKVEEERFLYWADRLGFLVWEEFANAYLYSREYVKRVVPEWMEVVERDYNHPCIVAWVPLNESWGVDNIMCSREEQAHSQCMYHLTKSMDSTRMVISNDGWNHTKSDLLTVHDYTCDPARLKERYQDLEHLLTSMPTNRTLFAKGYGYEGQPVIVSEFGGIAYKKSRDQGWGYAVAESGDTFLEQYEGLVSALAGSPVVQGFVYTQICDVEQEINGLLTYDREPKVPLEEIRRINEKK